jgi:hypothetical protein
MRDLSLQTVSKRGGETPDIHSRSRWIAVAILAALIFIFRDPYQFANPQFWAEDATIFFSVSVREASINFVHPYAGYFHFGPRLFALLGALFPAVDAPVVFFYSAFVAAVASVVAIYLLARTLPTKTRILFALAPLLVLPAGEVYGSVTNIQWFFGVVLGILVLTYRGDTFRAKGWLVLGAALALTGPFSVIFWPCFLGWSALTRRLRTNAAMLTVIGVGALTQLAAIAITGATKYGVGIAGPVLWLRAFGVFTSTFVPIHSAVSIVGAVVILALLAHGLRNNLSNLRNGYLPLGLVCLAAVTLFVGLWSHKSAPDFLHPIGPGARYYFQPFTFLFMAIIASVPVAGQKYARLCVIVILLLVIGWSRQFRIEERSDLRWRDYFSLSQVMEDAAIPILPDWLLHMDKSAAATDLLQIPVDSSKVEVSNGVWRSELGDLSPGRSDAQPGTDPELLLAVPPQCVTSAHRFLRVATRDAARAHLYFPDAEGKFSEPTSLAWHIDAGDHWYFDVPHGIVPQLVRLDVAGDSKGTVHGVGLSWVCWSSGELH